MCAGLVETLSLPFTPRSKQYVTETILFHEKIVLMEIKLLSINKVEQLGVSLNKSQKGYREQSLSICKRNLWDGRSCEHTSEIQFCDSVQAFFCSQLCGPNCCDHDHDHDHVYVVMIQ